MKLGDFIENFSHNNMIRLHYKTSEGYQLILDTWDDVSMDWEVNRVNGPYRHYINNEVIGLVGIAGVRAPYSDAINIIIERLESQPIVEEVVEGEQPTCANG